jgi:hypothetical protein
MDKKPGDSTQPLSESQVVAVTPKPPIGPNDQSVAWKGNVVGPDEFAPAPRRGGGRGKWIVVGALATAAVGGGAYALWPSSGKDAPAAGSGSTAAPGSASATGSGSAEPATAPAPVPPALPADAPAAPTVDAAPTITAHADAAPADAAPARPAKKLDYKKKPTKPHKSTH